MDLEPGISPDYLPMDPKRLLERMHTALNTRDVTNLLMLLQVDFEQFYPAGSVKETTGREAARQTYEELFEMYPNFRADLKRQAIEGSVIWVEWQWSGSRNDGTQGKLDRRGVMIYGVEEGLIAWSRSYMLEVNAL